MSWKALGFRMPWDLGLGNIRCVRAGGWLQVLALPSQTWNSKGRIPKSACNDHCPLMSVPRCAGSVDPQPQTRRSNPSLPSRKNRLYYTYNSASRIQSLPYNFKPERAPNYPRGHPYSLTSTTPHIPALNVSCVPGSGSVSTFLTKNFEHQSDILYIGI